MNGTLIDGDFLAAGGVVILENENLAQLCIGEK